MSDPQALVWLVFLPPIAGVICALLLLVARRVKFPTYWFDLAALVVFSLAQLAEGALALLVGGTLFASQLAIALQASTPARILLLPISGGLLCMVFLVWEAERGQDVWQRLRFVVCASVTEGLAAAALLATDRLVSSLCLMLIALAAVAATLPGRDTEAQDRAEKATLAGQITGAVKHVGLSVVGTALLLVGALLLMQYSLSLENAGLLKFGIGLLALGIAVRAGIAPFSAASSDLVWSAPAPASLVLAIGAPTVLIAGLLMLAPIEGSLVSGYSAAWLGAIGALLAGVRALGATQDTGTDELRDERRDATLAAMAVALQSSWALYGILSGSRSGAAGGLLLAVNLALVVPLVLASTRGRAPVTVRRAGLVTAAMSLLGLPPFAGFAGTLLISQASADSSGLWLAILLLGSILTAAGWLRAGYKLEEPEGTEQPLFSASTVVLIALIASQIGLFLASGQLANVFASWSNLPWLALP